MKKYIFTIILVLIGLGIIGFLATFILKGLKIAMYIFIIFAIIFTLFKIVNGFKNIKSKFKRKK